MQFRAGASRPRRPIGFGRRLRALPETEELLRRDTPWLSVVLARARRSLVPASSCLGPGVSRLQSAPGTTERLRAQSRVFQCAVRAGGGRGTPACRGGPHHVRDRLPAHRKPIIDKISADIPEDDKRWIWAGNAVEFFHLVWVRSPPEQAELGADECRFKQRSQHSARMQRFI